ncbi:MULTISPECIES: 5-oxoprolinase subunit PxpB [unclassified Pseudomonas]|jgi:KipI family sensor histidine kinase inhibitor|uniref:5-oxoprolinase subunit PxpB n=1 Tax=unclassified Pseudomonas TaxID=196821 RepID=UPI0009086D4A|nr:MULTISPECIES: 5-oxoprolinase subunit PxpB [unclassified Pseudomonas]ROO35069.1 allophanate hydrolase [Pseudomonas sp. 7SR1]ROO42689.1 allophanate hydrolase [Pseudomonas sp. AF76]SFW87093.1 sensor histidine kinase inhibitor, KipI family [Pseudomonas sp. NFACC09-4]SFY10061.1 sensor histidine kinase inhibitor, KipI family [Pseudomonas sp. NFACC47-1]SFY35662.1 sensor histidine kinase inhibitor, KipI family [Pseudomonas sp. NFACC43]
MKPRVEVVAVDCLMVRLFDAIAEDNMPWMLAASERLREGFGGHLIDLVPSYTTLMVHYDLLALSPAQARELIVQALDNLSPDARSVGQRHVLPVWYDPSVGPELGLLARRSGLSVEQVIRRHSEREYQVFALGFAPGFAFMGLVDEVLAAPRLDTPRKRVAAGSVGIAERQTAAYPVVSPGGWNLIGRTPARLFDRERDGYSLMRPGDTVRFEAVGHAEFIALGGDDTPLEAQA